MPCPQRMGRMQGLDRRSNHTRLASPDKSEDFPDSNPATRATCVPAVQHRQAAGLGSLPLPAESSGCIVPHIESLDSSLPDRTAESDGTTTSPLAARAVDSECH